jgi:hypothetical protein
MADSSSPTRPADRQTQLKRLVEEDCEDEIVMAETRKRIKLREIEREALLERTNDRPSSSAGSEHDGEVSSEESAKEEPVNGDQIDPRCTCHDSHVRASPTDNDSLSSQLRSRSRSIRTSL